MSCALAPLSALSGAVRLDVGGVDDVGLAGPSGLGQSYAGF